jgi:hypothetical protein
MPDVSGCQPVDTFIFEERAVEGLAITGGLIFDVTIAGGQVFL